MLTLWAQLLKLFQTIEMQSFCGGLEQGEMLRLKHRQC